MKTAFFLLTAMLTQGCVSYDHIAEQASNLSCAELIDECNAIAGIEPRKSYVYDPGPRVTGYSVNLHSSGYGSAYGTVTPYTRPSQQSYYNSGVAIGNAVRVQRYNTIMQVCMDQYAARCKR